MTTTNSQGRRDQNGLVLSGRQLARAGWGEIKGSQNGTQKLSGAAMMAGGGALWGYGKIRSGIQRGSLAVAKNAAEKGWISQKAVAPLALGLAVGATIFVAPAVLGIAPTILGVVLTAAEDVVESAIENIT